MRIAMATVICRRPRLRYVFRSLRATSVALIVMVTGEFPWMNSPICGASSFNNGVRYRHANSRSAEVRPLLDVSLWLTCNLLIYI